MGVAALFCAWRERFRFFPSGDVDAHDPRLIRRSFAFAYRIVASSPCKIRLARATQSSQRTPHACRGFAAHHHRLRTLLHRERALSFLDELDASNRRPRPTDFSRRPHLARSRDAECETIAASRARDAKYPRQIVAEFRGIESVTAKRNVTIWPNEYDAAVQHMVERMDVAADVEQTA